MSMYETAGYESSNYFKLLGPILLIVLFLVAVMILKKLIACAISCCPENCCTRYFRRKTDYMLFFMRFLLESCIEIGLSSLITVVMVSRQHGVFFLMIDLTLFLCFLPDGQGQL